MKRLSFFVIIVLVLAVMAGGASPAYAACTSPEGAEGDMIFNEDQQSPQYCNGTDWIRMLNVKGKGPWSIIDCPDCNVHYTFGGAGANIGCSARNDGSAYCWGRGNDFRLGFGADGDILFPMAPVATESPPAADPVSGAYWRMLRIGPYHSCGLRSDSSIWCWGKDSYGKLGYGGGGDSATPVKVDDSAISGSTWTYLGESGDDHSCAIRDSGEAYCWGRGSRERLGYGGTSNQSTPRQVSTSGVSGSNWTQIGGARRHSCGLRDDGTAWCWGWGSNGRVGNNNLSDHDVSTPSEVLTTGVSGSSWTELWVGIYHNCAMRDDETVWCWGQNDVGQLGIGNNTDQGIPQEIDDSSVSGTKWTHISPAGSNDANDYVVHTCGIRDDGTAWCWGSNDYGKLGINSIIDQNTPQAVDTTNLTGTSWLTIKAHNENTCGLRDDRSVWCWGRTRYAVQGVGFEGGTNDYWGLPTEPVVDLGNLGGTAWGLY